MVCSPFGIISATTKMTFVIMLSLLMSGIVVLAHYFLQHETAFLTFVDITVGQ